MSARGSHACLLSVVVAMALPAPAVNGAMSLGAGGVLGNAKFPAGQGSMAGPLGGPEVCTLSGEVDAECGCLLESSCTHGSAGVAAARSHSLQLLDQADDLAFIRNLRLGALGAAERAASVRSTCGREVRRRAGGSCLAKNLGGNSTSLRMAGSSLSVITKRSTRCWTPNMTAARSSAVRGLRDNCHIVLHSEDSTQRETLAMASAELMVDKLQVPRLLSPSSIMGSARGEIVSRLRGLQGRFEVSKGGQACSMVMLRGQPSESPAPDDPSGIQHALAMYGVHENEDGARLEFFHAPRAVKHVHQVPTSDTWLEEGNSQDRILPPLVAELLRRVAEDGDRAMEEDGCEIVPTSKPAHQSAFHAQRRPKVSLVDYAERMCKYGGCSPGCLALSLVYMDRFLRQTAGSRLTGLNVHRLLLSCVLVATKQWDDTHHNNAFWAKVGGIGNSELNSLERYLLAQLDYSLLVDKRDWEAYRSAILAWGAALCEGSESQASGSSSRDKLDTLLALPSLRKSVIFGWSRDALRARAGDSDGGMSAACSAPAPALQASPTAAAAAASTVASAAMTAYSPEGPGAMVLSGDDSYGSEAPGLAAEDIYVAAHRQMCGGLAMGQRRRGGSSSDDGRWAKQKLTGGAGVMHCSV